MTRLEKAKIIGKTLDELYPETPIPLDHSSAYTLIVAVMLSAQTTDKKVNQVKPSLFKIADTPEKMYELNVSKIQSIIKQIVMLSVSIYVKSKLLININLRNGTTLPRGSSGSSLFCNNCYCNQCMLHHIHVRLHSSIFP